MSFLEQKNVLSALNPPGNTDNFLGNLVEVAMVTDDCWRLMAGLQKAGIGPWRVHTFSPENVSNQMYRGTASEFTMKACFAQSGALVWELIQPLCGPTIFQEFLDRSGEGIHHVAYDCNNVPFEARVAGLEDRGYKSVQSGNWEGKCQFAFFETQAASAPCLETYAFKNEWTYPEPDEWFPPVRA